MLSKMPISRKVNRPRRNCNRNVILLKGNITHVLGRNSLFGSVLYVVKEAYLSKSHLM